MPDHEHDSAPLGEYVMVPRQPTDRMMIAGGFSFAGRVPNKQVFPEVHKVWDAMLGAAPTLSPTVSQPGTGEVTNETAILRRLADGDAIVYSQDGDDCWFSKGDRAHIAEKAIISLRDKGYIERRVDEDDDTDNYRGMAEYDAISAAGREALTTITGGENER